MLPKPPTAQSLSTVARPCEFRKACICLHTYVVRSQSLFATTVPVAVQLHSCMGQHVVHNVTPTLISQLSCANACLFRVTTSCALVDLPSLCILSFTSSAVVSMSHIEVSLVFTCHLGCHALIAMLFEDMTCCASCRHCIAPWRYVCTCVCTVLIVFTTTFLRVNCIL